MAPLLKPEPRVFERKRKSLAKSAIRRDVYAAVDRRENYRCRVFGTPADPRATDMLTRGHHHHIVFRSRGGNDTTDNLVLLSAEAHALVHARRLWITGNANQRLTFEFNGRTWKG